MRHLTVIAVMLSVVLVCGVGQARALSFEEQLVRHNGHQTSVLRITGSAQERANIKLSTGPLQFRTCISGDSVPIANPANCGYHFLDGIFVAVYQGHVARVGKECELWDPPAGPTRVYCSPYLRQVIGDRPIKRVVIDLADGGRVDASQLDYDTETNGRRGITGVTVRSSGRGQDQLVGTQGEDRLLSLRSERAYIAGLAGNDQIVVGDSGQAYGGPGDDQLYSTGGASSHAQLFGRAGDDLFSSWGPGSNQLGAGKALWAGGSGLDTFLSTPPYRSRIRCGVGSGRVITLSGLSYPPGSPYGPSRVLGQRSCGHPSASS